MSNIENVTVSAPAAPVDASPAPAGDSVPRAEFERLQKESQTNRERADRLSAFESLPTGDREAVAEFARLYGSGNTDAAAQWLVDSARALSGDRFDQLVSAGKTPVQAAAQVRAEEGEAAPAPTFGRDDIEAIIEQRMQAERQAQVRVRTAETLQSWGYDPNGHEAAGLLAYAVANHVTIEAARQPYEDSMMARAQEWSARRAATVPQGGASPNGRPVVQAEAGVSTREQLRRAITGL